MKEKQTEKERERAVSPNALRNKTFGSKRMELLESERAKGVVPIFNLSQWDSILLRQAEANSFAVFETEGADWGRDKSSRLHRIQQLGDQSRSPFPCLVEYSTRVTNCSRRPFWGVSYTLRRSGWDVQGSIGSERDLDIRHA